MSSLFHVFNFHIYEESLNSQDDILKCEELKICQTALYPIQIHTIVFSFNYYHLKNRKYLYYVNM